MEMHKDPYQAAKELRILVRKTRERVENIDLGGTGSGGHTIMEKAEVFLRRAQQKQERTVEALATVRAQIKSRHPMARDAALAQIESHCKDSQYNLNRLSEQLQAVKKTPSTALAATKEDMRQIHILAQALQTEPGQPVTPADNVLRAVATVLAGSGYIKSSTPVATPIPVGTPHSESEEEPEYDEDEEEV